MSSAGGDYPIAYVLQVEGDSEVKSKLSQVDKAFDDNTQAAEESANATGTYSGALGNLANQTETTKSRTQVLGQAFKESSLGIATLASSATGLYFQYDNLEKAETRVDRAEKTLLTSRSALITAQERIVKLNQDGVTSGALYEKAQIDLKAAQDGVQIATDRLNQAQGDLTQGQIGFALGVLPTVFSALSTIQSITMALRAAKIAEIATTATQSTVNIGAIGSFTALSAATTGQTLATGALTTATRILHIAMGPVGWIIGGIGAAMAIFATNAFGVRDAINAAGKAIGDAFPIMKPLLDGLSSLANMLFPDAKTESKSFETEFTANMQIAGQSADSFYSKVSKSTADIGDSFETMKSDVNQNLIAVESQANSTALNIKSAAENIRATLASLGGKAPTADMTVQQQNQVSALNILPDSERSALENFVNVEYPKLKAVLTDRGVSISNRGQQDALGSLAFRFNDASRMLEADRLARQSIDLNRVFAAPQATPQAGIKIEIVTEAGLKAIIDGKEAPQIFLDNIN